MPVLIGWAAVTGSLAWPPVILFGVVFFWTPPHFWALAIRFREDYERAGVPMLPVVAAPERVARDILLYSGLTVATSLVLWPVATSWVYGVLAAAAGGVLLVAAHRLLRGRAGRPGRRGPCDCSTCRTATWPSCSSPSPSTHSCTDQAPYDRGVPAVTLATCAQLPAGDEDGAGLTAAHHRARRRLAVGRLERSCGRLEHGRAGLHPLDVGLHGRSRCVPGLGRSARPGREPSGRTALELRQGVPARPRRGRRADRADVVGSPRRGRSGLPPGDVVVKPSVGAGSMGAGRFDTRRPGAAESARRHAQALHDAGRVVLVQPYLADVDERGETALIYLDGAFSHAIGKAAMLPGGTVNDLDLDLSGALFRSERITARIPADDELARRRAGARRTASPVRRQPSLRQGRSATGSGRAGRRRGRARRAVAVPRLRSGFG